MSKERENIVVYQPKTLEQAKELFAKFKQMNLRIWTKKNSSSILKKVKEMLAFV